MLLSIITKSEMGQRKKQAKKIFFENSNRLTFCVYPPSLAVTPRDGISGLEAY